MEDLPRYMAIFMAGLAAAAISFATTTTVRQRRRDLAVLRVLGMTGRHVRSVVVVLVLALTGFGALLGGALGIIVGRQVWRAVMGSVSLPFSPSLPVAAVVLVPIAVGRPGPAGRQHQPPGGRADPRRRRAEDRVMATIGSGVLAPQPRHLLPPCHDATGHGGGMTEDRRIDGGEPMSELVLDVRGVRRTFEAENAPVRALRGTDFQMDRGEFVAIMGPSGCGKSTLLNLVAGLDQADEGTIVLADEEVTGKTEDELARMRRKHIGIVFQFFNLLEGMTVLENVALPAMVAGLKRKPAETRGRDLLDLLGLSDKAKAAPGSLSGGQRQRLAIARALANEPTLLLADEPTGALDSEGGQEVIELFRRLHASGQTILMVTHDDDVAAAAERIARMKDGKVISTNDEALAGASSANA